MKKIFLLMICSTCTMFAFSQSTVIGTTTYDVQTNNGSKNHTIAHADGTVSAGWTGSSELTSAFSDRGTFYNFYDGTDWGAFPSARTESVRTGFGEIVKVGDHEVSLAHFFTGTVYNVQFFANDAIGGTSWTELDGSDDVSGLWAFSDCPEGTDDLYVVTANTNPPTGLNFSRSDDGGATWAVLNYALPYLTTDDGIASLANAADSYQIRVNGSDVYVLFAMVNTDIILLHSDDYGNAGSWERTDILDFPYDSFIGSEQTDVNGDLITDTIGTNDGYCEMLITDDGTLHVFSGYMRLYSDGLGFYTLNYRASGIWHWSTGMAGAELINTETDWSGDGNPYGGIGAYTFNYRNAAVSSCPTASWDASTNRLYLLYTMKIEYTDIYDDPLNFSAESFRDIFGIYSDDGGATWNTPANLTNTAESGEENFYVCAADRVIDGKIHATWQQDDQPGHFNEGDAIHSNNILHQAFTDSDFSEEVPGCDYTVGPGGLFADDITGSGATLNWDAVDLASKYIVNIFEVADFSTTRKAGSFTNSLEILDGLLPLTNYGFRVKTVCFEDGEISPFGPTYYFTTGSLKVGTNASDVNVFPNPATDVIYISLSNQLAGSIIELYNVIGEKINVDLNHTSGTEISIDVQSLNSGTYILKIIGSNDQLNYKVMVE